MTDLSAPAMKPAPRVQHHPLSWHQRECAIEIHTVGKLHRERVSDVCQRLGDLARSAVISLLEVVRLLSQKLCRPIECCEMLGEGIGRGR